MKKTILILASIFSLVSLGNSACSSSDHETSKAEPTELQLKLEGTYVPLFSEQGIGATKWNQLWQDEAAKYVGQANAAASVEMLKNSMAGTVIGADAISKFGDYPNTSNDYSQPFQFDCNFTQGVAKFVFSGRNIKGLDKNGKQVFSHNYSEIGYDKDQDMHEYKSDDSNQDEFTYFFMRSDTPSDTYHLEFRYGSDPTDLLNLRTGRYAYWMASAIREENDADCEGSIKLFVKENLSQSE